MAIRVLPSQIIEMLASRRHRLRHFLWHAVRGAWNNPQLTDEVKAFIRDKGWAPPNDRVPLDAERKLILDNHSGEDFLYMHRQMIKEVGELLEQLGEQPLTSWRSIPKPGEHPDFALPPAWTYNDPSESAATNAAMTARLQRVKSDAYFRDTIATWESFYTNPANLAQLSLGALGNLLEMTIHNNLHMRWASVPIGYMPSPNFEDTRDIDPKWDAASYDYLGDTYSSHVNPIFWYLHGWVNSCIDRWATANRVSEIAWIGTWTGKLEDGWTHGAPEALTASVRREAMGGRGHGHAGHEQDDEDIREMEAIVRKLGSCKVVRNFYDVLRD
ncbi:hypothetical protein SAMN05216228_102419 [Rhizobium tibeticum]|uniref:Uncharacterized protein n=1 Tax=Rhizobium tibeticum TaxID=501024 RepID=A0A1H8SC76_9HYPH|nr:hypothetical protein [Rhizobium tibeticum]SEI12116.1 hypothetical protein RTCCBAU85039_4756 [Rhizobium tibeticum]SEO75858.1 hypothetical protein SAMN05216228_102419 [Rhizobium tibeticum]